MGYRCSKTTLKWTWYSNFQLHVFFFGSARVALSDLQFKIIPVYITRLTNRRFEGEAQRQQWREGRWFSLCLMPKSITL